MRTLLILLAFVAGMAASVGVSASAGFDNELESVITCDVGLDDVAATAVVSDGFSPGAVPAPEHSFFILRNSGTSERVVKNFRGNSWRDLRMPGYAITCKRQCAEIYVSPGFYRKVPECRRE